MKPPFSSCLIAVLALVAGTFNLSYAGSATWTLNPASGDWNTATNWMPNTVPNGSSDVATFAMSNQTAVAVSAEVAVDSIVFSPGASAYTISAIAPPTLTLGGAGVVNSSGVTQNFVSGSMDILQFGLISFTGSASAGTQCIYTAIPGYDGGEFSFLDQSTAASATFILKGGGPGTGGLVTFHGNATAGSGTFNALGSGLLGGTGGTIIFSDNATAGTAVFTQSAGKASGHGGTLSFLNNSTAADATITNDGPGPTDQWYSFTDFEDATTGGNAHITNKGSANAFVFGGITGFDGSSGCNAGNAVIINEGGLAVNAFGGETDFYIAAASNANITCEGGLVAGSLGGLTLFKYQSDAQTSTLIANGGPDEISAGQIRFENSSQGGTARVILAGNGKLDLSNHAGKLTIGSAEGAGAIFLGSKPLGIGSSNLSTVLGAIVQDGGYGGGSGGSLIKVGTGTLTLTGANTYTGGTNISAGTLMVANTEGSGTGTGAVTVSAGTLGGTGTIAGAVTVGTGAFFAPAGGTNIQATLTVQGSLIFNATATYTYSFKAKKRKAKTDKVVANGVTINSSANFNLSGQAQGTLTQGLTLTVIDNTAATPIAGTFSNLPDGAILTVNGNNLQASYEGGDGNDLTLTVVP